MQDEVILVVGATGGLGETICKKLLEKGRRLIAHTHQNIDKIQKLKEEEMLFPGKIDFQQADITNKVEVQKMLDSILEKYGRIDAVINCAGIIRDRILYFMSEKEWDTVINVNLKGTFLLTQAAIVKMLRQKQDGVIIHIASDVGLTGNIGQANYAASKAGMIGFTKSVALEYEKKKIYNRCVVVGALSAGMSEEAIRNKRIKPEDPIMPVGDAADQIIALLEEPGNDSVVILEEGK